jgi:hypothetical protein
MTELTTVLVALITAVIGPVVVTYIKEKITKKSDILREAVITGSDIEEKIEAIREDYKADRVWICQFHNGGHFYPTGKSIQKFSMFYEVVGLGVSSIRANFQNIPVSLFSRSINKVLHDYKIVISDFKDEKIATYGLKYIAEECGCKSGYIFALTDIEDKMIGIFGMDFTKKKCSLAEHEIHDLETEAAKLGGLLHNHLKIKK